MYHTDNSHSETLVFSLSDLDLRPAIETEERYFGALGRFVHTFAEVEAALFSYLIVVADIPPETARATFDGFNIDAVRSKIRRLHEVRGKQLDPLYEPTTQQLGDILSVRNALVHYGTQFKDGEPSHTTTERKAHTPDAVRTFPISADILDSMTEDLETIRHRVNAAATRPPKVPQKYHDWLYGDLPPPEWRYQHSARGPRQKPTRRPANKRSSPPETRQE